jgi:hypothetical protein
MLLQLRDLWTLPAGSSNPRQQKFKNCTYKSPQGYSIKNEGKEVGGVESPIGTHQDRIAWLLTMRDGEISFSDAVILKGGGKMLIANCKQHMQHWFMRILAVQAILLKKLCLHMYISLTSVIGVSNIRSGPNFCRSPFVICQDTKLQNFKNIVPVTIIWSLFAHSAATT